MNDTFASVMMALTASVTARVMTTLGLGFISYEALNAIASQLQADIFAQYALINPTILQVLNLAGLGHAIHIITAAFITRAGMMAIKRIGVLPTT